MTVDVRVRSIHFSSVFSWMWISRAIGCALSPTPFLAALITVAAMQGVHALVDLGSSQPLARRTFITNTLEGRIEEGVALLLLPVTSITDSFFITMQSPGFLPLMSWVDALGMYLVGTLGGVMLARMAGLQLCREVGPSLPAAARWSCSRIGTSLISLLTPAGCALALFLGVVLLALPGLIPGLGKSWLFFMAPVNMGISLCATAIVVLLPLLWALIVAAIAIDDADGFGAFSRAFSLCTTYFWTTLGLILVSILTGLCSLGLFFFLTTVTLDFLSTVYSWVYGEEQGLQMVVSVEIWHSWFLEAFAISLFWNHVAILYLVLRRAVDGTPQNVLAGYDDDMRFQEPFPVAGIPAARRSEPSAEPVP